MRPLLRLALPSKGRLQQSTLAFMSRCGFDVRQSATRGYVGVIDALPQVTAIFQRPRDIVISVANGGVDFGITGLDVTQESGAGDRIRVLHEALGFGRCRLVTAVPEAWPEHTLAELATRATAMAAAGYPLRVATVFPQLTASFMRERGVTPVEIVEAEGALEVMPEIGSADMICDLAETGSTLQQNRLRMLRDGVVLSTQACLIANAEALKRPEVMAAATELLEYFEAHLRADGFTHVFANIRGASAEDVADRMFHQTTLYGLQGPTISPLMPSPRTAAPGAADPTRWFAVNLIVRRDELTDAVNQLRAIGGSGVVVSPVTYIFEEMPERIARMKAWAGAVGNVGNVGNVDNVSSKTT
jgi:ATP phosphoribosyltransferase